MFISMNQLLIFLAIIKGGEEINVCLLFTTKSAICQGSGIRGINLGDGQWWYFNLRKHVALLLDVVDV